MSFTVLLIYKKTELKNSVMHNIIMVVDIMY